MPTYEALQQFEAADILKRAFPTQLGRDVVLRGSSPNVEVVAFHRDECAAIGEKQTVVIDLSFPTLNTARSLLSGMSHKRTVPSVAAEARRFPSGENVKSRTLPMCPRNTLMVSPEAASERVTLASAPPETTMRPSGEKAKA